MAEIVLKIPKEFEQDFNADKFKECFKRVLWDCKAWNYAKASGRYEHETLEMLLDAFNEAVVLPKGHGRLIDADEFKNYCQTGLENVKPLFKTEKYCKLAIDITQGIIADVDEMETIIEADKEGE